MPNNKTEQTGSFLDDVFAYVRTTYGTSPEYLWERFPSYGIFRHADNKKWYGLVGNVARKSLGLPGAGAIDILNVKIDDEFLHEVLLQQNGYLPAYHMNRANWISVLLDGSVPVQEIHDMIDVSYLATASKKTRAALEAKASLGGQAVNAAKHGLRPSKEWLVPSNPKYYDVVGAFEAADEIDWKQGRGIRTGDTVFMYVGAPYSAILYQCEVVQTDIPFDYHDRNVSMTALMRIRLQKRYASDVFPLQRLRDEFGVYGVRGPRGVPNSLSVELRAEGEAIR